MISVDPCAHALLAHRVNLKPKMKKKKLKIEKILTSAILFEKSICFYTLFYTLGHIKLYFAPPL